MYEETEFDTNYIDTKKKKRSNWWKWLLLLLLFLIVTFLMYLSYIYGLFNFITTGKISPTDEAKNILWANDLKGEETGDVNVLLLGMRGEEEVEPYITNAMMIMNLDLETKKINLISVPRDFWMPITNYGHTKANSVYKIARLNNGDDQAKNLEFCRDTFGNILGINIDYAFLLDFSGFKDTVDAIGQIQVSMSEQEATKYPFLKEEKFKDTKVKSKNDLYQFNGEQSLIFIRWPENAVPDFDRIRRQHIFLYSVRNQYLNYNVLLNPIKTIRMMKLGAKNIRTDFHLWELLSFMEKTQGIQLSDISKHYLNTTTNSDGGLLLESSDRNGVIYTPEAGSDDFSDIQKWINQIIIK